MTFGEKLINLRKKLGWSQEELAEQINISRQAVSKWESGQSIPDTEKIIKLSKLFNVSTDYLLIDDIESIKSEDTFNKEDTNIKQEKIIRNVSLEEVENFLSVKLKTSKTIAYAVFLCIISPVCLMILGVLSESEYHLLSENLAAGIGLTVLLLFVCVAVCMFISSGSKTENYEYLEKEVFHMEEYIINDIENRKDKYKNIYIRNNIIGVCLCILSVIPLFIGQAINDTDKFLVIMLSLFFIIAGIGVVILVKSGIIWENYQKLLQQGDYTKIKKERNNIVEQDETSFASMIYKSYWLIVVAIYLAYSFTTNDWRRSWIVFPIAAVLSPIIKMIGVALHKNKK